MKCSPIFIHPPLQLVEDPDFPKNCPEPKFCRQNYLIITMLYNKRDTVIWNFTIVKYYNCIDYLNEF